jgi:hypothetical protein
MNPHLPFHLRNLNRPFSKSQANGPMSSLVKLGWFIQMLMSLAVSACPESRRGVFKSFQSISDSCVRFVDSLFQDCRHESLSPARLYGGAIYVSNPDSISELFSCTFLDCGTSKMGWTDFGGGACLEVSTITVRRCCANHCYSEVGQFLCVFGCRAPVISDGLWCVVR